MKAKELGVPHEGTSFGFSVSVVRRAQDPYLLSGSSKFVLGAKMTPSRDLTQQSAFLGNSRH